jgi:hypothetical protein
VGKENLAAIRAGYREVRRIIRHGPSYPWRRYVAPARILGARAIRTKILSDVTVCVLTSCKDWLSCLWSLVSFYEFSDLRLPLLVYSDGTLEERHAKQLARVFPDARLIHSSTGNQLVANKLVRFPNCMRFRAAQAYARKIIDFPILCGSPFILMLDSDVLFLKRPAELMRHLEPRRAGRFIFERDYQDAYCAARSDLERKFGVNIASCVNTGIALVDVSDFNFLKIEQWLRQDGFAGHAWGEQTLWAMYAGRERTALLSQEYDVTTEAHIAPETVAKHYIGPIREFLYMEGIPYLSRRLEWGVD